MRKSSYFTIGLLLAAFFATPALLGLIGLTTSKAGEENPENAKSEIDVDSVVGLLELVIDADEETARECLGVLTRKIQNREVTPAQQKELRPRLEQTLKPILSGGGKQPLRFDAALLAASWKNPTALKIVYAALSNPKQSFNNRLLAMEALTSAGDQKSLPAAMQILSDTKNNPIEFRSGVLASLGRLQSPEVAKLVLANYSRLEANLQPRAIELLTQRTAWSRSLLQAVGKGDISSNALNVNQIRKLIAGGDKEIAKLVAAKWGTIRTERNPQRQEVIVAMRKLLTKTPGDPHKGQVIFHKICGQCHKIHGQGEEIGPDITRNGRSSFEQLLSNVFDPSLVIGASYQAYTVITEDGRVLTGLLAEDSSERVILKMQGGKQEIIARDDVDEMQISKLSLMPEGVEMQLKQQEIVDLFAFLMLEKPPGK